MSGCAARTGTPRMCTELLCKHTLFDYICKATEEDNIKMDLRETRSEDLRDMKLDEDRVQWHVYVLAKSEISTCYNSVS